MYDFFSYYDVNLCDALCYGIETQRITYKPGGDMDYQLVEATWFDSVNDRDEKLIELKKASPGYPEYGEELQHEKSYYRYVPVQCKKGDEYTIDESW